MRSCIWRAISCGEPKRRREPVTSRKASSIETGSTRSVKRAKSSSSLLLHRYVGGHVDGQEDGLRAEALRLRHRHRRAHPAGTGLVGGRAHHAAALGPAADDDRAAAQFGSAGLLHRGEEGVHVDEQEGAGHRRPSCSATPALSSPKRRLSRIICGTTLEVAGRRIPRAARMGFARRRLRRAADGRGRVSQSV